MERSEHEVLHSGGNLSKDPVTPVTPRPAPRDAGRSRTWANIPRGAWLNFNPYGGAPKPRVPPMGGRGSGYRGVGPRGYQRRDDRIKDDVIQILTDHEDIDARDVEVSVENGKVRLSGYVPDRHSKWMAEDLADDVLGVKSVENHLRVRHPTDALQEMDPDEQLGFGSWV
ncbi:MAG: BON domain-containing protein [Myxococcota bacterium]